MLKCTDKVVLDNSLEVLAPTGELCGSGWKAAGMGNCRIVTGRLQITQRGVNK